jgi:hypothetical protein
MLYLLDTAPNGSWRTGCISSLPSWSCGFDSRRPLRDSSPGRERAVGVACRAGTGGGPQTGRISLIGSLALPGTGLAGEDAESLRDGLVTVAWDLHQGSGVRPRRADREPRLRASRRKYGLDRETAMTIEATRAPDPKTAEGPLTGIWRSRYEYVSSGRGGQTFSDEHYVMLIQHGANIQVRSLSESNRSSLIMSSQGPGVRGPTRAGTIRALSTTGPFSSCSTRPATGCGVNGSGTAGTSI